MGRNVRQQIATSPPPEVGILALQGNIEQHARLLESIGCTPVAVRSAETMRRVGGLVLPGGESSTMTRLLASNAPLVDAIHAHIAEGRPTLGTCAGLILLARSITPADKMVRTLG